MAFLEISGLRKRFGALEILKGIDLALEKGGFLVLVGPSGCGKSTLLNTIAGLESITSGEIRIDGNSHQRSASLQARHRDGVPVLRALSEHVGGAEHGLRHGDARRAEARARQGGRRRSPRRCRSSICSTAGRASSPAASASASRWAARWCGNRACSCSTSRCPISTPKLRVDMRIEIKRLHQQTGTTIVYVTHDQIEAMTLATKIAVLKDGELQQVGTPERDLQSPSQSVRRRLHGLAGDEPARRQGRAGQRRAEHRARAPGSSADRAAGASRAPMRASSPTARKVIFGIRPEAVNDRESIDRNAKSVAKFDANVEIVEPAGSDTFVVTHIAGKEVTARMRADADVRVGQNHDLRLQSRQGGAVRSADDTANLTGAAIERPSVSEACGDVKSGQPSTKSWSTSSSSARAWAARHSPPGSRPPAREFSFSSAASGSWTARSARRARDLSARRVPPTGDVDRRRRGAVQSRQLLLRRRQHEALRRGADPLSRARISSPIALSRGRNARLAVRL